MFTLRRLAELAPRTRVAKAARILQAIEEAGRPEAMDGPRSKGRPVDRRYLGDLAALVESGLGGAAASPSIAASARNLAALIQTDANDGTLLRAVNGLRHALLAAIGAPPSEWDLVRPLDGALDRSSVRVHPIAVYLEDIRSPFNVGSIFRTAEAFGVERLILSPRTPLPTHPRAAKTARGAERAVPWEVLELAALGRPEGIFALELGGEDIGAFRFPERGIVLVGSEELGLGPEALSLAGAGLGRVSIPLAGAKRSLNVSVAFGILMHRWHEALVKIDG